MSKAENFARDTYNLQNMFYKGQQEQNRPAREATQTWWDKLQEFEGQEGYGAIPVDWADIWDRAQEKVRYSYWGGPGGQTGTADKVKASAARRGVSGSPALETQLSRMGMQEGADIRKLASKQALAEVDYGEAGRQNWLSSLQSLSDMRTNNTPPMPMYLPKEKKGEWDWGGMATGAIGGFAVGGIPGALVGGGIGGAKGYLDTTSHDDTISPESLNAYASGNPYQSGNISSKAGAAKDSGGLMGLLGGGEGGGGMDIGMILQLLSASQGAG